MTLIRRATLQVGAIRFGVLDLDRAEPGDLQHERLLDAPMLADTACALVLDTARDGVPQVPALAPEPAGLQHPEAHQATGMISRVLIEQAKGVLAESLQLDLDQSFALLRRAARDRRLSELAQAVVDGTEHIPMPPAARSAPDRTPTTESRLKTGSGRVTAWSPPTPSKKALVP